MLGDLFGNMEERQEELRKKMADIEVSGEAADGMIRVIANANRQIRNISIDRDFLREADPEELEDLLLVAVNRTLEEAAAEEARATQQMIKDMLPPGMDNLFS